MPQTTASPFRTSRSFRHDARPCCGLEGDALTEVIRNADPETCRHEWVSLFPRTGRSLRLLAEEMDRLREESVALLDRYGKDA